MMISVKRRCPGVWEGESEPESLRSDLTPACGRQIIMGCSLRRNTLRWGEVERFTHSFGHPFGTEHHLRIWLPEQVISVLAGPCSIGRTKAIGRSEVARKRASMVLWRQWRRRTRGRGIQYALFCLEYCDCDAASEQQRNLGIISLSLSLEALDLLFFWGWWMSSWYGPKRCLKRSKQAQASSYSHFTIAFVWLYYARTSFILLIYMYAAAWCAPLSYHRHSAASVLHVWDALTYAGPNTPSSFLVTSVHAPLHRHRIESVKHLHIHS